jgi:WD40 repeat protein
LQHQDKVRALAFSPDGQTLLSGSLDKTAQLWKNPAPVEGDPENLPLGRLARLRYAAWQPP